MMSDMRGRMLLLVSTVLNLALLTAFLLRWPPLSTDPLVKFSSATVTNRSEVVTEKTRLIVRRQNFTWQEVESADYATYIRNLRDIGCPESTLRDIIIADVNQLYAHRRETEIVSADHQWWRSEPDLDAIEKASAKMAGLEEERRALLTRLLGANWEHANPILPPATRTGVSLSGPVLGDLSPETKQNVYNVTALAQQKIDAYQQEQLARGRQPDPVELARLRQQTRSELAQILNPEQMQEYLLRYSQTAMKLREEFEGMERTPEQFKALFNARDTIEQQLSLIPETAETARERQRLMAAREAAMKNALGPEAFSLYRLNNDPLYRQAQSAAADSGAPPAAVRPIYEINQATAAERLRILGDATLAEEDRRTALATIEAQREQSVGKILSLYSTGKSQ